MVGVGLGGWFVICDAEIGGPSIVNDANTPKAMFRVLPSSDDDFAVERNLTSGAMEEDVTTCVAKDSDG